MITYCLWTYLRLATHLYGSKCSLLSRTLVWFLVQSDHPAQTKVDFNNHYLGILIDKILLCLRTNFAWARAVFLHQFFCTKNATILSLFFSVEEHFPASSLKKIRTGLQLKKKIIGVPLTLEFWNSIPRRFPNEECKGTLTWVQLWMTTSKYVT